MDKAAITIMEYANELTKQNVVGKGDCISVQAGDYMYVTDKDASLADLKEKDVKKIKIGEWEG